MTIIRKLREHRPSVAQTWDETTLQIMTWVFRNARIQVLD